MTRKSIRWGVMAENYILVAGTAGGECALFQNHLVRYLILGNEAFSTVTMPGPGRDGEAIQDEWRALWSEGKLPTGDRQPKDYAYRVRPLGKHKDKPPLDFAFLEVSGAALGAFAEAGERTALALPAELAVLLGDPKLNFVLILLCASTEERGRDGDAKTHDALLASFVAHLKRDYGEEFSSRCPVLLLALKGSDAGDSEGTEAVIGANLPETLAALQNWQARYTLGELDMGDIEQSGDGELVLDSPRYEDTAKIFRWIYFQFTRYPVVEPFFARLWKSVRKSVS